MALVFAKGVLRDGDPESFKERNCILYLFLSYYIDLINWWTLDVASNHMIRHAIRFG